MEKSQEVQLSTISTKSHRADFRIGECFVARLLSPYWVLHLSLLLYVYGVGSVVYQLKVADGAEDFIKSYVNVSLLILTSNMSWWWLSKRPMLFETLKMIEESDMQARGTESLRKNHKQMMYKIKIIIFIFYMVNYMNAFIIYVPQRMNVSNEYSMALCVGLQPLTATPNRQICSALLGIQECTIMITVLNYQTLMLFLIAHTAIMYQLLAEELMSFNIFTDLEENQALAKQKLPMLISRHSLILSTCTKLKSLYSLPLGVDFGSNAICISLFFYLPVQEWLNYTPILVYCILSFFLYCFLCQNLMTGSEVFERAVYSCGWENFGVKEKKLVYVMLRQAQKPAILLAADIVPVNMYTFATTLKSMFKFVTVVKF